MGYKTVDNQIIFIKIGATPTNLNIIQVYAPTSSSTEEELDTFYGKLSGAINKVPKREILIVMKDFNAKIGYTKNNDDLNSRRTLGDRRPERARREACRLLCRK